jgi:hypothetical protein
MTTHNNLVKPLTQVLGLAHRGERLLPSLWGQLIPHILTRVSDMAEAEALAVEVINNHLAQPGIKLDSTIMERQLPSGKTITTEEIVAINNKVIRLQDRVADYNPADGLYSPWECEVMNYINSMRLLVDPFILALNRATLNSRFHAVNRVIPQEGGSYKFSYLNEALAVFTKGCDINTTEVTMPQKRQKGRWYPTKQVNYMLAGPFRYMFIWSTPRLISSRKQMATIRRQLASEYGVGVKNYEQILEWAERITATGLAEREAGKPETTALMDEFCVHFGIKPKKMSGVIQAALEVRRIKTTRTTQMVYWLDATSDGPMRISAMVGCRRLAHYCNIQGSTSKQSLWLKLAESAYARLPDEHADLTPFFCENNGGVWEPSKDAGKAPGTQLVYGAGRGSIARGLILSDPEMWDELQLVDDQGMQIPGRVEELVKTNPEYFNNDTIDLWAAIGLHTIIEKAQLVARLYYNALRALSPKMMNFIRVLREAYKTAADKGQPLVWKTAIGDTISIATWTLDDGPTIQKTFTVNGRPIRARCRKFVKSGRASCAPPLIVQADDGTHLGMEIIDGKEKSQDILGLHDARGVRGTEIQDAKKRFKRIFARCYFRKENRLVTFMQQMGIPLTEIWKGGIVTKLDRDLFRSSRYFIG